MLSDQEFRQHCDRALDELLRALVSAMDRHDFEADLSGGALTIEFENPPAKFVVSPNAPVRQIWVSAHSQSFKLGWSAEAVAFTHPETGRTLKDLVAGAVGRQLGEEVVL